MQHVATWKEGDEKWAYHDDAFANIATHKVSLDPYRLESRRILACIKDALPAPPIQRVEKASVDEVFLDLSAQVHSILVERYPELSDPAPRDDPTELLPRPSTSALDWNSDALVDLDNTETEDDDPDWDDIAMLVGSEIVRSVRAALWQRLKYTCSAGIARNKMIAKLGSAYKKPNQQTIVRNRAVQQFLSGFKFTKIRNLGGKLGEKVVSKFGSDQVKDLLEVSLEQLKHQLGDDTGSWVYEIIRGEDSSEVNSRTQIQSMLSAKSFRPTINTIEQASRWVRIFASDIFSRLVEEGLLENRRRPKTINLHHRQGTQMRSRQAPIPTGRPIDQGLLFDIAMNLLKQIVLDGRAWPCSNLQLSAGGFEDGPSGNQGIGSFLVRGDQVKTITASNRKLDDHEPRSMEGQPEKRRKMDKGAIQRFFIKRDSSRDEGEMDSDSAATDTVGIQDGTDMAPQSESHHSANESTDIRGFLEADRRVMEESNLLTTSAKRVPPSPSTAPSYSCDLCKQTMVLGAKEEHEDWHYAKTLQAQVNSTAIAHDPQLNTTIISPPARRKGHNVRQARGRTEKGQSRLVFGR
jgi:DNA polymerase eta